jgi:cysteine desulfurase/selenocysteine lyase
MPEVVFETLRGFDCDARANVHECMHRRGRAATAAYNDARASVARYLHVETNEVVFTYGTTSAINLLAHSFGALLNPGDEIVLSVLEHHSNIVPWQALQKRGVVLKCLQVTPDGRIDLSGLQSQVSGRCRLIAVTHCSNVTGAITDVRSIVDIAASVGAQVMLDGAQRAPHGPVDLQALGVDFYAFSGHKTYGPMGIGILWGKREFLDRMPPFMFGGQMIDEVTIHSASFKQPPRRFEAGTPPIAQAVGLGAALNWAYSLDWHAVRRHELNLTQRLLSGLASLRRIRLLGPADVTERRGVVTFVVNGFSAADVCRYLDTFGVALRGGHHCAQPLMRAFGVCEAARASIGPYNNDSDIEQLLEGLESLVQRGRIVVSPK